MLSVVQLSGEVVLEAEAEDVPESVMQLKERLAAATGTPPALQRLYCGEGELVESAAQLTGELTLVVDESPTYSWDIEGNPDKRFLRCDEDGRVVWYKEVMDAGEIEEDYVNVVTRAPVRSGTHYFRCLVHRYSDECWVGVCEDAEERAEGGEQGYFYYSASGGLRAVPGELHFEWERRILPGGGDLQQLKDGDAVDMLLDVDGGCLVFGCNGVYQGACRLPQGKCWYLTCVLDMPLDRFELAAHALADAPGEMAERLSDLQRSAAIA